MLRGKRKVLGLLLSVFCLVRAEDAVCETGTCEAADEEAFLLQTQRQVAASAHGGALDVDLAVSAGEALRAPPVASRESPVSGTDVYRVVKMNGKAESMGAKCLDGSPGAFYIRQSPSNCGKSKHWSIHLQGGGWCYDGPTCYNRSAFLGGSTDLSFDNQTAAQIGQGGVTSPNCTVNPLICNYNLVMLVYCDGASFSGDREDPFVYTDISGVSHNLLFRGRRILEAAIDTLIEDYSLCDATEVLLGGDSAGGMGVFMQSNFVQKKLSACKGGRTQLVELDASSVASTAETEDTETTKLRRQRPRTPTIPQRSASQQELEDKVDDPDDPSVDEVKHRVEEKHQADRGAVNLARRMKFGSIPGSGFFIIHNSVLDVAVFPTQMNYLFYMSNWTMTENECPSHFLRDLQWLCMFPQFAFKYAKGRFFVMNSAADFYQIGNFLAAQQITGFPFYENTLVSIWSGYNSSKVPGWIDKCSGGEARISDCDDGQIGAINGYMDSFEETFTSVPSGRRKGSGAFLYGCYNHNAEQLDLDYMTYEVDGITMRDALAAWWDSSWWNRGRRHVHIEKGRYSFPANVKQANPSCNYICDGLTPEVCDIVLLFGR